MFIICDEYIPLKILMGKYLRKQDVMLIKKIEINEKNPKKE